MMLCLGRCSCGDWGISVLVVFVVCLHLFNNVVSTEITIIGPRLVIQDPSDGEITEASLTTDEPVVTTEDVDDTQQLTNISKQQVIRHY